MEQAGREDWMLSKGIEDERMAIGGEKEEDWRIKCFPLYPSLPLLFFLFSLLSKSPALALSLSAQIPGHFGGT